MIKIGITGQSGFVGTHLYNTLGIHSEQFERIPFEDSYFQDETTLKNFILKCDVIIHLAAVNRHVDSNILYNTNIELVNMLISACEQSGSKPHIIFSSSIQEESNSLYGNSKKDGRALLEKWAIKNMAKLTSLIIPNVFGPFGNPNYNSVVATFCHQLSHNLKPQINNDSKLNLIYVGDLVMFIINFLINQRRNLNHNSIKESQIIKIPHTSEISVSTLLKKLNSIKEEYFNHHIVPNLNNPLDLNLFNTFLCYIDLSTFFPVKLKMNNDIRGSFVEIIKLNSGGQVSFSSTSHNCTRGNHYHTRKTERFAIIKGNAKIELRRIGTEKIITFEFDSKEPSFVDIPIWHTHNITNIGKEDLYTIFWINEFYNVNDPDTFYETV